MNTHSILLICFVLLSGIAKAQKHEQSPPIKQTAAETTTFKETSDREHESHVNAMPFGAGGQVKMLYDRRQRPQAVYLNHKVHIVYNYNQEFVSKEDYFKLLKIYAFYGIPRFNYTTVIDISN